MSDITIVTAFFDIGRGNLPNEKHGRVLPQYQHRGVDTYFEYFNNLAKIKNDMVIYTTEDFADRILEIRKQYNLENKTHVISLPSYLPKGMEDMKDRIEKIMDDENYWGNVVNPQLIEYWHSDYVLVNIFKSFYVQHAINSGIVKNKLAAWIDFGYVRNLETLPSSLEWKYPFDEDKIHFFNMRDIDPDRTINDIIYTGDVYIQGCHIVAGVERWKDLAELMMHSLQTLVNNNLIDDDQTLLLMSYITSPYIFQLRPNSPHDWFRIFKDYNDA